VYGPNFSEVSHKSGSTLKHGIASRLIRRVFVALNTESGAILKCSSIEIRDNKITGYDPGWPVGWSVVKLVDQYHCFVGTCCLCFQGASIFV
jgi:hypothetical protein